MLVLVLMLLAGYLLGWVGMGDDLPFLTTVLAVSVEA